MWQGLVRWAMAWQGMGLGPKVCLCDLRVRLNFRRGSLDVAVKAGLGKSRLGKAGFGTAGLGLVRSLARGSIYVIFGLGQTFWRGSRGARRGKVRSRWAWCGEVWGLARGSIYAIFGLGQLFLTRQFRRGSQGRVWSGEARQG